MRRKEAVVTALRDVGYRMTSQRAALLDAIWAFEGHFTVERVREALTHTMPSVDDSTIYRTLDLLTQLGVLTTLTGQTPTEFERPREPHHHLVCSQCGTVTALADYHFDHLLHHLLEEHGFVADITHLAIPGRCTDCQDDSAPAGA
jgi:Fur family transcriptional regulator, ferric uptake regulator